MKLVRVTTTFEERSITTHMSAQRSIRSVILWTLKKNKANATQAHLYGAFSSRQDGGGGSVQIPGEVTLKRYLAQLEKGLKASHQQLPSTSSSSSSIVGTIAVTVRKKEPGEESNFMKVSGKASSSSRSREIMARIGDFFSIKKSTRLDRSPNGRTLKKLFGSTSGSRQNESSRIPYDRRCDWLAEDLENVRPRSSCMRDEQMSIGSSTRDGSWSSGRGRMSYCESGKDSSALLFRQFYPEMSYYCHNRWISNCDLHQKHSLTTYDRRRSSECLREDHVSHSTVLRRRTNEETKSFGDDDESNVSVASKSHSNIRLSMGVSQRILKSKQNLSLQENSKTLNQSMLLHKTAKRQGETLLFAASTPTNNIDKPKPLSAQKTGVAAESDTSSIWESPPSGIEVTFQTPIEAHLSAVNDVSDAESDSVFQVTGTSIEADFSLQNTPVTSKSEFCPPPLKMRRKRYFTDLTDSSF